jgi:hypothetical protein
MTKTVTALFDHYADASAAVRDLEAAGFSRSDISLIANNTDGKLEDTSDTAADAGTGAGVGAAVGGAGGLLAGLGLLAIPGVGPVVAAGWLAATAAGAAAGALVGGVTGGVIGAMTESGVPERDAHVYAEGVRRGGTLVSARVEDSRGYEADAILRRFSPVDITARGTAYRDSGWQRFDPEAPAYTPEQLKRERMLY